MKNILFCLLLFASCSSKPSSVVEMDSYKSDDVIKKFLIKNNIQSKSPIVIRNVHKKYIAICKQYDDRILNTVHINNKYWDKLSDAQKKLTLIHEIGHCDKLLDHNDELMKDKCPASIMHHKIFSSECFNKHEKMYRQQVFGNL